MSNSIYAIGLCHSGKYAFVVSGYDEPRFEFWDVSAKTCLNRKKVPGCGRLVSFKVADDREAVVECRHMSMKWSLENGIYDVNAQFHPDPSAAGEEYYEPSRKSPDGYRKFSWTNENKTLQILDVTTDQCIASINHSQPVRVAAFHPYARLIVWAGTDNLLRLWNLEEDKLVSKWQTGGDVTACTVTQDERIVCGDSEGNLYVVDTPFVPGRVVDSDGSTDTSDKVSEILNTVGEQKKKIVGFIKEKWNSVKNSDDDAERPWWKSR